MGSYEQFVDAIMEYSNKKISSYVCVANVHMLAESYKSPSLQEVVNSANIVTPDGMPLAKAFKYLYQQDQIRVDGMSLLPLLLQKCIHTNQSVFFYGGTPYMLERTRHYLKRNFPELEIAGTYSPPFRTLTEDESAHIVGVIKDAQPNIVFVVLGCPKQEWWMAEMKGRIPSIMIGVGGALPVLIGMKRRAPVWMQRNSLEWFFRFVQEPKRLFKRYYKSNRLFLYLMLKAKLNKQKADIIPK